MTDVDWPRVGAFLALITAVWHLAGRLKLAGRVRPGDARKLNHVTALVGGALLFGWLPPETARPTCWVGCGASFLLLLAVCRFRERPAFRAMFRGYARESDAPHEAFHVWFSWLISVCGLLVLDCLFWDMTVTRTAALVLGVADGIAEPVGVRWGRTKYRVPTLPGEKPAVRSVEGSAAVLVSAFAVVLVCRAGWPVGAAAGVAAAVTLVEALSPHGLDNLTIPLTSGVVLKLAEV